MPLEVPNGGGGIGRRVGTETGKFTNVVGDSEVEHIGVTHTRPGDSRQTRGPLNAQMERDLIGGRTVGNIGELGVEAESLTTGNPQSFVTTECPPTFGEYVAETLAIGLPVASKVGILVDLGPQNQSHRAIGSGLQFAGFRWPLLDASVPLGDVFVERRVSRLGPEDDHVGPKAEHDAHERRLTRLGRADKELVLALG